MTRKVGRETRRTRATSDEQDQAAGEVAITASGPNGSPADDAQRGVTRTSYGDVEHVVYSVPSGDAALGTDAKASTSADANAPDVTAAEPSVASTPAAAATPAEPPEPEFDRYGNRIVRDPPGTWTIRFDTGGVDVSNERRYDRTEGWDDYDPLA